jgi:D-alanine--D-alanine ligase
MKRKIAIICGGPSAERGISLNSARSLYDNLDWDKYDISIIYINPNLEAYPISAQRIYSNTPLDFDYKLYHEGQALDQNNLIAELKKVDLVFPVIHGIYGEDGQLQTFLEDNDIKYLGSGPEALQNTADKYLCQKILKENGFYTLPSHVIKKGEPLPQLIPAKYVAKPLHGGSSIGIQYFETENELLSKLDELFYYEPEAIIEPFCEGTEFTVIVLENSAGKPAALFPTEIEMHHDQFFSYRKKYLPTSETRYYTPARFDDSTIEIIQKEAEKAFNCLGMKDFARLDGWLLKDGTIWFSDINGISGMEQNSFIFQQASLLGLSHRQLLDYIINKKIDLQTKKEIVKEDLPIIFGGDTTEREVSLMSGTNVYIKLKSSDKYRPVPLLKTTDNKIYQIPHFLCLHHTVEEIEEKIRLLEQPGYLDTIFPKFDSLYEKLGINIKDLEEKIFPPVETTIAEIALKYKFLFIALHGGEGEDGTLQKQLDHLMLPYNGPGAECSRLCMDKFETGKLIEKAGIEGISTARKMIINRDDQAENIWQRLQDEGYSSSLILKPNSDGCSSGVIRVDDKEEFLKAINYFRSDKKYIPEKAIHKRHGRIELPKIKPDHVLVEECIFTDKAVIKDQEINWRKINSIIEVTVGVFGEKENLQAFLPSQTIVTDEILSLEEKFMGGTGINLTPPPEKHVNHDAVKIAQLRIKKIAELFGIEGYSRIDTFMNIKTGDLIIIEINTLPALTASTVIFHQAIKNDALMMPLQFIEKIIEIGKKRFENFDHKGIKRHLDTEKPLKTKV